MIFMFMWNLPQSKKGGVHYSFILKVFKKCFSSIYAFYHHHISFYNEYDKHTWIVWLLSQPCNLPEHLSAPRIFLWQGEREEILSSSFSLNISKFFKSLKLQKIKNSDQVNSQNSYQYTSKKSEKWEYLKKLLNKIGDYSLYK